MDADEHRELARRVLEHRLTLKMLPRPAAEVYVDRNLPDLDDEAREYALSFAAQNLPPKGPAAPQDALFCAAMFLAGVSLGDLSRLFGIAKQTVHQKVSRRLNRDERQQRDQLQILDLEVLALCRRIFNEAVQVSPTAFDGVYPTLIGRGLLKSANAIVREDRGDDPLPARPRRYSNMNISQKTGQEQAAEILEQVEQPAAEPNTVRPEEQDFLDTL
jgi:hypothetical protein